MIILLIILAVFCFLLGKVVLAYYLLKDASKSKDVPISLKKEWERHQARFEKPLKMPSKKVLEELTERLTFEEKQREEWEARSRREKEDKLRQEAENRAREEQDRIRQEAFARRQAQWQEEQAKNAKRRQEEQQKERDRQQREESARQRSGSSSSTKNGAYYGKVLGLFGKVTMADVKKKYRELVSQYHPDKVNHLGDKLKKVAEDEMKEINEAYEYFKRMYE